MHRALIYNIKRQMQKKKKKSKHLGKNKPSLDSKPRRL